MAPRPAVRREPANVDYSAVGKLGRRTGVTLDQRPLDANGIEEISGIFSSPHKPSPLKNMMVMDTVEEASMMVESVEMSTINNSRLTPTHSARRLTRNTPARPPRSSSPRKSGISGAARKSNGVDIFSARKSLQNVDEENQENTPLPTPTLDVSNLQPHPTLHVQRSRPRRFSPSPDKSPLGKVTTITPTRVHNPRASLLGMQQIENEVVPSVDGDDYDSYQQALLEVEAAMQDNADFVLSTKQVEEAGRADQVRSPSEELGDPGIGFDVEVDRNFEPEHSATPVAQNKANSRKKRRSDAMDPSGGTDSPRQNKIPKKKGRTPVYSGSTLPAPSPKPQSLKAKGKQPLGNKDTNLKLSSRQEKELEEIVERVKDKPGPPRSLHILRRETPADDGVTHTRCGRVSVKPLAYWRNERCVYGTSPSGVSLADGARFPLNSIKEIVRTEEVAEGLDCKRSKGKKRNRGQKGKGKTRQTSVEDEDTSDSDFDLDEIPEDPDAEPWETETGTLRGNVSIWDHQGQGPTEQEEEVEIAHAPAAIKTREIKGSSSDDGPTFRYAKLLSTKFFGTGLVDLPPGGIKRPKNSRKMHMSFFVVKGRVTVAVGPLGGEETGSMSRFSIGKGGYWQVPRGNQYSIENEMEKPARIFFSQGCEPEPAGNTE